MRHIKDRKMSKYKAELERIADINGGVIRPEYVVETARSEASPLHDVFEWDDTKAAHEHRLWQARQLIRCTVDFIGDGREMREVNCFISLPSDRKADGGYRRLQDVLVNNGLRDEMMANAKREMVAFMAKYRALEELANVFEAMGKMTG